MILSKAYLKLIAYSLGLLAAGYASAHVSVSPAEVSKNSYQKLTFNISHGCGDSPTKEVTLYLPIQLQGAKPIPKAGWVLEVFREPLSKSYVSHGKEVNSDVRKITWRGGLLPNEYADEFSIRVKVDDWVGNLPVVVHQICEQGKWEWSELPQDGKKLISPAPIIKIIGTDHHAHH